MAVVNHPNAPYHDADGNDVWPECQCDCNECFSEKGRDEAIHPGCKYACGHPHSVMEDLGNGRSISREFGGCATCNGGGCRDCST